MSFFVQSFFLCSQKWKSAKFCFENNLNTVLISEFKNKIIIKIKEHTSDPWNNRAHIAPSVGPAPAIDAVEKLVQVHEDVVNRPYSRNRAHELLEPERVEIVAYREETATARNALSLRGVPSCSVLRSVLEGAERQANGPVLLRPPVRWTRG